MKSMGLFEQAYLKILQEDMVSGGSESVFGVGQGGPAGSHGNQFPSQNDQAYAPNDTRLPKFLTSDKKKKKKVKIQRRPLPGLEL